MERLQTSKAVGGGKENLRALSADSRFNPRNGESCNQQWLARFAVGYYAIAASALHGVSQISSQYLASPLRVSGKVVLSCAFTTKEFAPRS